MTTLSMMLKTSVLNAVAATALLAASAASHAAEPLHNTTWQTIDDETGKPKAIVKMTEKNGKLMGQIQSLYQYKKGHKCQSCKGKYAQKPLDGAVIVWNLQAKGNNSYANGRIFDPRKGKSYKLKAELANDGKTLKMRGYIGSPMLGRTQTWKRLK